MTESGGFDLVGLHSRLRAAGATVGTAESLTAGLLAAELTRTPGSSATVRGGLVVYATDLKASLAGVPEPLLAAHGPVSPQTAAALAGGAREVLGSTYGIALTGVAGPEPVDDQPVGRVFLAIAGPAGTHVRRVDLPGDRDEVRRGAVVAALALLAESLPE